MKQYEPRPHNYTADFLCGIFLEAPVPVLRKVVPGEFKLLEHLPGMGMLTITFFDYTGGYDQAVDIRVGSYRSMVISAVIAPYVENREQHPHTCIYPINFCIKDPTAVDVTRRGEMLPVYDQADWNFEYGVAANRDLSIRMTDGSEDIITARIHNDGVPSRDTALYFQAISTDPDGTYRLFEATFAGQLYEHQKEDGLVTLHPHEAFRGLDVSEVNPRPVLEMTLYDAKQHGQVSEALAAIRA